MKLLQLTWVLSILLAFTGSTLASLDTLYEWKYIDYVWDCDEQKETAINCGQYNASRIMPNDIQPLLDGRVIITTPKYHNNPASVSVISTETGNGGPLLSPYPNWSWHKEAADCSGITNAGRIKLDECNRLWIVDSGKIGNTFYCPAKILIFNATSDELIDNIEIPIEVTHKPDDPSIGYLEIQVVETEGNSCEKTWVYIADVLGGGLVVYDHNKRDFWRRNEKIYAAESDGSNFTIRNTVITMHIGLHSMIPVPTSIVSEKSYLFKPMSAYSAYGLKSEGLHEPGSEVFYYKTNYSTPEPELERDMSSDGIMISGFPGFVACWNTQHPLVDPYVVVLEQDTEMLPFISGVRISNISQNGVEGENVWIAVVAIDDYVLDILNTTVTNFRIFGGNVATLVEGTNCAPTSYTTVEELPQKYFFRYNGSAV